MKFEFDPEKSEINKAKHGVNFDESQLLWEDPDAIGFPAKSENEERFALLAVLNGRVWFAFYTLREDQTRLISVRRARKGEKKLYES